MSKAHGQAEVLSSLISGIATQQQRPRHEGEQSADIRWSASHLLYQLLVNSEAEYPDINVTEATRILNDTGERGPLASLDDLSSKQLLREVLGRCEIPRGVGVALLRFPDVDAPGPFSSNEHRSLSILKAEISKYERPTRLLKRLVAGELLDSHRTIFPETPSLSDLIGRGFLEEVEDGDYLRIPLRSELWDYIGRKSAALLWELTPTPATEAMQIQKLQDWQRTARNPWWWLWVPQYMGARARGDFLDAIVQVVTSEPDIEGWDKELDKLTIERDFPANQIPPLSAPTHQSPLARREQWEAVQHRNRSSPLESDCRDDLDALIGVVVKNDTLDGAYNERGARLLQLIEHGESRPHLARVVPRLISRLRPEAWATLLLAPDTTSLALVAMGDIDTRSDGWSSAQDRMHQHSISQMTLWAQAVPIALEALGRGISAEEKAAVLAPLSASLSKDSLATNYFNPEHGKAQASLASDKLLLLLDGIEKQRAHYKTNGQYRQTLLDVLPSMAEKWIEDADKIERPEFASFPTGEMRLLFWALTDVFGASPQEEKILATMRRRIAEHLSMRYEIELQRETWTPSEGAMRVVHWTSSNSQQASFPWARVAEELVDSDRLKCIIEPCDFAERVGEIGNTLKLLKDADGKLVPTSEAELETDSLLRTWGLKTQLQLRLLLGMHEQLSQEPPADPTHARKLMLQTEEAVASMLCAANKGGIKGAKIFHRMLGMASFSEDPAELLGLTVKALGFFRHVPRDQALQAWLEAEDDPDLWLSVGSLVSWHSGRTWLDLKVADLDLSEFLARTYDIRTLERLARATTSVGIAKHAETIIVHGEERTRDTKLESEWQELARELRLSLAVQSGEIDLDEALRTNAEALDSPGARFQQGILLLQQDAAEAVHTFESLLQERPGSGAVAANLFSARVFAAEKLETTERRVMRLQALRQWHQHVESLSESQYNHVASVGRVVELRVLAGLDRFDAFVSAWEKTPEHESAQEQVLSLAIATFLRAGRKQKAVEVLQVARAFHCPAKEDAPSWLTSLAAAISANSVAAPSAEPQIVRVPKAPTLVEYRMYRLESIDQLPPDLVQIYGRKVDESVADFLLHHHINTGESLQTMKVTLADLNDENKYNHLFAHMLQARLSHLRWSVREQDPGGASRKGKRRTSSRGGEGSRDWLICSPDSAEIAVSEALRIRGNLNDSSWDNVLEHLDRVRIYDAIGLAQSYLVSYVESSDFEKIATEYGTRMETMNLPEFPVIRTHPLEVPGITRSRSRLFVSIHDRSGFEISVFHLLYAMASEPQ